MSIVVIWLKNQSQLRGSDMKNDCANLMPLLAELGAYGCGFYYKHVAPNGARGASCLGKLERLAQSVW
jgi:hypothetical protein